VRFPDELDLPTLAALVLRVAQHAQWDAGPMELRRHETGEWAQQNRYAAVLATSGILRAVGQLEVLSLTLSLSSAQMLNPDLAKGRALRSRLVSAVQRRAPASCGAVLERLALAAPPARD
jgi:hypothetical protein